MFQRRQKETWLNVLWVQATVHIRDSLHVAPWCYLAPTSLGLQQRSCFCGQCFSCPYCHCLQGYPYLPSIGIGSISSLLSVAHLSLCPREKNSLLEHHPAYLGPCSATLGHGSCLSPTSLAVTSENISPGLLCCSLSISLLP